MPDQVTSVLHRVDLQQWFVERKLDFKPKHFVTVKTPLHKESALWIMTNLRGRFTFEGNKGLDAMLNDYIFPSFEDPAEAILYELKWG